MEVCVDSVESAVNAFRGGQRASNACCTLAMEYDVNNWHVVKCGSADLRMLTRVKCGLIMRIFRCGFTGKMRTRLQIFYVLFILQRQAYCLGLKTVRHTLGHTNYTQVLGERFLTCKLHNLFNKVLKWYPK